MIDTDAAALWTDAHVFYQHTDHGTERDPLSDRLAAWDERMRHHTPNGALLETNSMFDQLRGRGTVNLLHITQSLDQIADRGVLYPSGGCLVGSVYCTLLTQEDNRYRMHNLGRYLLDRETVLAAKRGNTRAEPVPLIIEVDLPERGLTGWAGIDYLRLGLIHLRIYRNLEYLLASNERHQLRDNVTSRVREGAAFLAACASRALGTGTPIPPGRFLEWLVQSVPALPILGYLYFETLSEYLMLHTTTSKAVALREAGEFDNWGYKELLFAACPEMAGRFNLARFAPHPGLLRHHLADIEPSIDLDDLFDCVADRIALLATARLLTPAMHEADWFRLRFDFEALLPYAAPLLGHLIHRELRSFARHPDFYFYFDQVKALECWNAWNHLDLVLPFNAAMPKGEIGINPAYPNLQARIYTAERTTTDSLAILEPVHAQLAPRLVDLRYTLMRARTSTANRAA
jgi:hypothetical protein